MILSDDVITLRPRTLADVDAQMAGQDELYERWLEWDPPSRENVTAMIVASSEAWSTGLRRYDFGVVDASTGQLIGNALANHIDPLLDDGEVNVAYGVFPAWRGRGTAGRVVELLCEWLAESNDVTRAVLKIDVDNVASRIVAERLGFVLDGTITTEDGSLDRFVRPIAPGVVAK
jgi:RimJ/RimL family protein N-acetyltransferase